MEAVVSDILQRRKREPEGLKKTAAVSCAVHVVVFALLAALPSVMPKTEARPRIVMQISLGGAPGPDTGGTQMLGGRAIEAAPPSAVAPVVRHVPPSVTTPKMTLPDPKQNPREKRKPAVSSKDPKGTLRGRGFETQEGTA